MHWARQARRKCEHMVTHSVLRLDLRLDSFSQDNGGNDGLLVSEHTKTAALRWDLTLLLGEVYNSGCDTHRQFEL